MFFAIAFITCFAGAILPIVNADAFVVAAALIVPAGSAAALIAVTTGGQVAGKLVLLLLTRYAGSTAQRVFCGRRTRLAPPVGGTSAGAAFSVFVSAAIGIPPFFVVTLVVAAGGMTLMRYTAAALPGRAVRTAVLVLAPRLLLGGGS